MNVSLYNVLCFFCVAAISARIQKAGRAPSPFLISQKGFSAENTSSQQRNKREKRLTHVVVPFHYSNKQLDRLMQQSELWRQFPPCLQQTINVKLIWYVFADPNEEQLSTLYDIYNGHYSQFSKCFSGFEIKSAGLGQAEDNPDMSSRRMFEKMLDNSIGLEAPDFVLNIEPDVFPVKSNWLILVQRMLDRPTRRYWVIGSAYLGRKTFFHHTRWACVLYHINGNALYDVGSGELRRFYFGRVRPFMERMMPGPSPYDVDIKRFLFSESNAAITRQVRSKFLYSDFIANWWRRPISWEDIRNVLPDSIFVHSGQLVANDI